MRKLRTGTMAGLAAVKAAVAGILLLATAQAAIAQSGDKNDPKAAMDLPAHIKVPPSPVVPPNEALSTFTIAPGYKLQMVASEPLVNDPVAITFDPDGRIWAVEMRGYMPNVDGQGEDQPIGRIVVLEDADGDWIMDKSTVFLDGLVLPRAIALARGGVIVGEPPNLLFCQDTDGDLKSDKQEIIATGYGSKGGQPEHMANGLTWGMNNTLYSGRLFTKYRFVDGKWVASSEKLRGQWGLSIDNAGRLYFNSNSQMLSVDWFPTELVTRNRNYSTKLGQDIKVAKNNIWPIRVTPGVNRGYKALNAEGKLTTVTAACGPGVYRGDLMPELVGNVFVCEPACNLISQQVIQDLGTAVKATQPTPGKEFLASVDERFRPVNVYTGPDGALYVVDMYRGILQHKAFVTTWLRKQILARGLDKPLGLGRIYRVVPDKDFPQPPKPRLSTASTEELVATLGHANGWHRDTAQRLLVERADASAVDPLRSMVASTGPALGKVHALWTLDGLGALDEATLVTALKQNESAVKIAALHLAGLRYQADKPAPEPIAAAAASLAGDMDAGVRVYAAFALGALNQPVSDAALAGLITQPDDAETALPAAMTGLGGRELEFLERLRMHQGLSEESKAGTKALEVLSTAVVDEGKLPRVEKLLDLAAGEEMAWRQRAMLRGVIASARAAAKPVAGKGPIRVSAEPEVLSYMDKPGRAASKDWDAAIKRLFTTKAPPAPKAKPVELDPQKFKVLSAGRELFVATCAPCHQESGLGQEGLAPPLSESPWVNGPESRVVRIVLQGLRGPVVVKGEKWDLEMPALGTLTDEQIASILTYVRASFDNDAPAIDAARVKAIRAQTAKRDDQWTAAELMKIK